MLFKNNIESILHILYAVSIATNEMIINLLYTFMHPKT